jgi:hypothetical protein
LCSLLIILDQSPLFNFIFIIIINYPSFISLNDPFLNNI